MRRLMTPLGVLAAVLLVAAGYTLYWFAMADRMQAAAEAWRADFRASGGVADWRGMAVSGFPLWLDVRVTQARLGRPGGGRPWLWQAPEAGARMRPWDFRRVAVDLAGAHDLQLTVGERTYPLSGRAGALDVVLERRPGGAWQARADLTALALTGPPDVGEVAVAGAEMTAERLRPADGHLAATWRVDLRARGVTLPAGLDLPLGRQVGRLLLDARLLGRLPPGPLEAGLPVWRDDGGTVEIKRLEAEWGPLAVQGDGTLALDAALQPIGAFAAKVQGFFEAIEELRRAGLVDTQNATAATVVLGVLARRPPGGGRPSLSVPLSIQNRILYAGPVPILPLQEVRWTGAMPDL